MRRFEMAKLVGLCLLFAVSCRHHRRTAPAEGKATWSFGVPRGTTVEAAGTLAAPIQLTASDGTGLKLVSLDAKIAIEGPLALTELTMGFENPLDRTLEGHFDVVLPAGAAVSRFAMKLPSGWQEAEVVEKQAARVAYEDFLHRKQDPALLEKAAGNAFSARVFPIAGRAIKQIKLSYSQELPSVDEPYRLPLRGLPLVPALQIIVYAGETALHVAKEQFTPDADFLVERPGAASGLQSGKLVVARLRPALPASASQSMTAGMVILFDTSASRAPGFARQVSELGALVEELRRVHGEALPLRVASFDQDVAPLYAGTTGGFAHDAKTLLDSVVARGALGASDLAGALAWAARTAAGEHQRLVLVTDGVATASASDISAKVEEAGDDALAIGRAADGLKARFDRVDAILVGGIRDEAAMRPLVTHHLAHDGAILDGSESADRLVHRLDEATHSDIRVSVDGAAWVWPTHVDGMQRGDDLVVYAEMSSERERESVSVTLSGSVDLKSEVPLASPDTAGLRPLVERAWARARIASLGVELGALGPTERERGAALHKQIVDLSTRYRVLSDDTALLVLESEADYARFRINRHALADILVVDESGLHLEQRKAPVVSIAEDPHAKLRDLERRAGDEKAKDKDDKGLMKTMNEETGAAGGAAPVVEPPTEPRALKAPPGYRGMGPGGGGSGSVERMEAMAPERASQMMRAQGAELSDQLELPRSQRVARAPAAMPPPPPPATAMRANHASGASHDAHLYAARARSGHTVDPFDPMSGGLMGEAMNSAFGRGGGMAPPEDTGAAAYTGKMAEVMDLVAKKEFKAALAATLAWRAAEPGDVLALVALGNAWRADSKLADAARAYGSIIDLFPARADLRRFAGDQLEALGAAGEALAADSFAHAVRDRADHPNSHRLRAYALLRAGHAAEAFAAIEAGAARKYPEGRFAQVDRILREDAGLIAAAWLARDPKQRADVEKRLAKLGATLPTTSSLRFVLSWETDANDVDFHIRDAKGNRAWYAQKHLATGGDLYADVTTGYGPECFTIEGKPGAYPYNIQAHYYSRGPMGYGMGKVEIIEHDGKGGLRFEERPFVVMNDHAFVDLGTVAGSLPAK